MSTGKVWKIIQQGDQKSVATCCNSGGKPRKASSSPPKLLASRFAEISQKPSHLPHPVSPMAHDRRKRKQRSVSVSCLSSLVGDLRWERLTQGTAQGDLGREWSSSRPPTPAGGGRRKRWNHPLRTNGDPKSSWCLQV